MAAIKLVAGYATIGQGAGPMIVTERAGLFAKHGLDVKTRLMGGAKGVVKGLVQGEIQFGNLAAPALLRAVLEDGADFAEFGLNYALGGIATRRETIREAPDIVRRFVAAYVEGMNRYRTDREFTVKVQREYSGIADPSVAEETYDLTQPGMPAIPYPVAAALEKALKVMAADLPSASAADPEQFIDDRFIRALAHSASV
jgi:ABC-type nitrate/sulfonate/bicarbonate transport system substrate-binding protein